MCFLMYLQWNVDDTHTRDTLAISPELSQKSISVFREWTRKTLKSMEAKNMYSFHKHQDIN